MYRHYPDLKAGAEGSRDGFSCFLEPRWISLPSLQGPSVVRRVGKPNCMNLRTGRLGNAGQWGPLTDRPAEAGGAREDSAEVQEIKFCLLLFCSELA